MVGSLFGHPTACWVAAANSWSRQMPNLLTLVSTDG